LNLTVFVGFVVSCIAVGVLVCEIKFFVVVIVGLSCLFSVWKRNGGCCMNGGGNRWDGM